MYWGRKRQITRGREKDIKRRRNKIKLKRLKLDSQMEKMNMIRLKDY